MVNLFFKINFNSVFLEMFNLEEFLEKKVIENDLIDCLLKKIDEFLSYLVKL